jgi:uncharacterized cupin superfamily protein
MEEKMAGRTQEIRHLHAATEQLYYILEGGALVAIDGSDVSVAAGRAVGVAPGVAHQIRNDQDADLRFLVISSGPPRADRQDLG